jgi:hypothetical protein
MSAVYGSILVVHVIVAVLGLGSITSVAIVAAIARRGDRAWTEVSTWLSPLLRYSALSLAAMLVTGILLDLAARDAFSRLWWFRGSALLLVATGALHGLARQTLRRGHTVEGGGGAALRRIERIAYGMCALVGVIVVLMEVKPL